MENKTYIVQGDYLILKPEVEKPELPLGHPALFILTEADYWEYKRLVETYEKALSSQPRIKRADGGLWKEGQEVPDSDFEVKCKVGNVASVINNPNEKIDWVEVAIPINTNQQK